MPNMPSVPPDNRWQMPRYLDGEAERIKERNSRPGLDALPFSVIILILPFVLLYKAGKWIFGLFRRD